MPYLTDLADACRKSGLKVVEVDGWKTRGHGGMAVSKPQSIICHHTATSDRAQGDIPTLNVLIRGHGSLKGPLSQIGLSRSGIVYVIAAGRCYHAGPAFLRRQTNSYAIGIECEASGAKPIEGEQLQAYHRLVRALMEHYGVPLAHVESHGEIAAPRGRKNDILNNMTQFRNDVANITSRFVAGTGVSIPSVSKPTTPKALLAVDGQIGPNTVRALQKWLQTVGKFNFSPSGGIDGGLGPFTVSALQVQLARNGLKLGRADGKFGPQSARALERFLGLPKTAVPGLYPGLIRGLQKFLNEEHKKGVFK